MRTNYVKCPAKEEPNKRALSQSPLQVSPGDTTQGHGTCAPNAVKRKLACPPGPAWPHSEWVLGLICFLPVEGRVGVWAEAGGGTPG